LAANQLAARRHHHSVFGHQRAQRREVARARSLHIPFVQPLDCFQVHLKRRLFVHNSPFSASPGDQPVQPLPEFGFRQPAQTTFHFSLSANLE
jgi:hypothetical protein